MASSDHHTRPDPWPGLTAAQARRRVVCDDPSCAVCRWWLTKATELTVAEEELERERRRLKELALLAGAEANARRLDRIRLLPLILGWVGFVFIVVATVLLGSRAAAGAGPLYGAALGLDAAALVLHRVARG